MSTFEIDETFKEPVSQEDILRTKDHIFTVSEDDDFIAIVPEPLVENFNIGWKTKFDAVAWIVFVQQNHVNGSSWELEKPKEFADVLWREFSDTPTNNNDEIDQDFLHFKKGTSRFDIWHWFEESFDVNVEMLGHH